MQQHSQIQQLQAELAALSRHKQQLEAALARDTELAHAQSQRHQQAVSQLTQEAELLNGKLIKLRASRDDLQRELYGLKERKIRLLEDIEKLQGVEEQMISEVNTLQRHKKALLQETPYLSERARASAALALVYEHLRARVIELSATAPGALADAGELDLESCALLAPSLGAALGPPARPPSAQEWQPPVFAAGPAARPSSLVSSASLQPPPPPPPPAAPAAAAMRRSGSFTSSATLHQQHHQQHHQQQQLQQLQQQQQQQQQPEEGHPYLATALAVTSQAMMSQPEASSGPLPSSSSWSSQPQPWQGSGSTHMNLHPLGSAPAWLAPPGASSSSSSSTPMQLTGASPSRSSTPRLTGGSEAGVLPAESREHTFDMASLAALLQQHNLGDGEALRQLQQLMLQQQAMQGQAGSGSGSFPSPGSGNRGQQVPGSGSGMASYPPPKYKPQRVTAGDIASAGSSSSGGSAGTAGMPTQQSAGKGPWSNTPQGVPQLPQQPQAASEPLPTTLGMTSEQLAQLAAWSAEGLDTSALFKLHSM